MCQDRGFEFRSFPVLDDFERLSGVLTGTDIEMASSGSQTVQSAMTREVVTGSLGTSPREAFELIRASNNKPLPLIDSDRKVVGYYLWSDLKRIFSDNNPYNTDQNGQLIVAAAVGTGPEALERARLLIQRGVDVIVIDAAHGDNDEVLSSFENIRCET